MGKSEFELVCEIAQWHHEAGYKGTLSAKSLKSPEARAAVHRYNAWVKAEAVWTEREAYLAALRETGAIALGNRDDDGDGEAGGTHWWVFPASMTDEEITERLNQAGISLEAYRPTPSAYDCTGRYFSYAARFKRGRTKVLVTKRWARDI